MSTNVTRGSRKSNAPPTYQCVCPDEIRKSCWDVFHEDKVPAPARKCPFAPIHNCYNCNSSDHKVPLNPRCTNPGTKKLCPECGRGGHVTRDSSKCLLSKGNSEKLKAEWNAPDEPQTRGSSNPSARDQFHQLEYPFDMDFMIRELGNLEQQGRVPSFEEFVNIHARSVGPDQELADIIRLSAQTMFPELFGGSGNGAHDTAAPVMAPMDNRIWKEDFKEFMKIFAQKLLEGEPPGATIPMSGIDPEFSDDSDGEDGLPRVDSRMDPRIRPKYRARFRKAYRECARVLGLPGFSVPVDGFMRMPWTIDSPMMYMILGGERELGIDLELFQLPGNHARYWQLGIDIPKELLTREPGKKRFDYRIETDGFKVKFHTVRNPRGKK